MLKAAALLISLGSFAGVCSAAACLPGTITTYETAGSCTVDGVTFSTFSVIESSPGDQSSEFLLSPASSGGAGFDVTYVPGSTTSTVDFGIQYSFDPPPAIGSARLRLDVEGSVTVTEGICPGGNFTSDAANAAGCLIGNLDPVPVILTVSNPGTLDASATFTPVTDGQVRLIIHLDGTPADPAGFDTITATLASAPEPATFALLLPGLIAIAAYKRRALR